MGLSVSPDLAALSERYLGVGYIIDNKATLLTGGTETLCYTVGDFGGDTGGAELLHIMVAASTAVAGTASVKWTDASSSQAVIPVSAGAVGATIPLELFGPHHMAPSDTIKVTGANLQHVIITVAYRPT